MTAASPSFAAHILWGRSGSGSPSDGRSVPLGSDTRVPHEWVGGGHFYHPDGVDQTVPITCFDILWQICHRERSITSRYFLFCGVTSPSRYFARSILPPRTLLARWRLAIISLVLCAARSEWKTEGEKRRAQSSSVSVQLVFQVWRRKGE